MFYKAKEFILKSGLKVTLKSPEVHEARDLLNQIIEVTKTTEYLTSRPEDFDRFLKDIKKEEDFITSFIDSKNYLIAAYVNGKLIGNCAIKFLTHEKDKHRALVGIAIIKEYQGLGIGSLLFDELINIARNTEGIEQIELDGGVISRNEIAKALYTKKGFVKVGDIPHQFKLKDGTYLDGEMMVLFL